MNDQPLEEFLERLASADPTPGGGTASAVAGAVAAGLVAMVARLSAGKGADDAALARAVEAADAHRRAFLDLAARDAEAFDGVMRAMRLPRGSDEEKRRRQAALQAALRGATDVPLEVASRGVEVLERAAEIAKSGNPNAVSDAGVAALLAHAAVHGALLNVQINAKAIKDAPYRAGAGERARELAQRADVLRDEAVATVGRRLG